MEYTTGTIDKSKLKQSLNSIPGEWSLIQLLPIETDEAHYKAILGRKRPDELADLFSRIGQKGLHRGGRKTRNKAGRKYRKTIKH
jgi:hypothetical protein